MGKKIPFSKFNALEFEFWTSDFSEKMFVNIAFYFQWIISERLSSQPLD